MLILAGVVVSLALGENGIFSTASGATQKYKIEEIRERIEIVLADLETEVILGDKDLTVEYALIKLEENGIFEEIDQEEQIGIIAGHVITLGYNENEKVIIKDIESDEIGRIQVKLLTKGYTKGPVEVEINVKTKKDSVKSLNIPQGIKAKDGEMGVYEIESNGNYLVQAVLENGKK